jgi:hypothetical protein
MIIYRNSLLSGKYIFVRKLGPLKMDSDEIGGLVAIFIFVVLPIIIGLICIIYARALVRSRLRFLARDSSQLEPSDTAVLLCRLTGVVVMVVPIICILIGVIASFNQPSW